MTQDIIILLAVECFSVIGAKSVSSGQVKKAVQY